MLIVGAEILSRIIDPDDRATSILFGDGAAAAVLSRSPDDGPGVLAWDLGCDGSAAGLLEIRAGGSRMPATAETIAAGEQYLKMQGQEVTEAPPEARKAQVIDLMSALKASLEKRGAPR